MSIRSRILGFQLIVALSVVTLAATALYAFDVATKTATRAERLIALTPREFALLTFLAENAGTVVSRARLLNGVWGLNFDPGTKTVDVYIRYLRQKVDSDFELKLVKTVRGFGYMLSDSVNSPDG